MRWNDRVDDSENGVELTRCSVETDDAENSLKVIFCAVKMSSNHI